MSIDHVTAIFFLILYSSVSNRLGNFEKMRSFAGLLCFIYLTILLVTLSHDAEINPGPRPPKYPCDSCGKAVKDGQNSNQCDSCNFRFQCEGLSIETHQLWVIMTAYHGYA